MENKEKQKILLGKYQHVASNATRSSVLHPEDGTHSTIQLGKYQHYKGNMYEVIGIAKHSETLEELVLYKPQQEHQGDFEPIKNNTSSKPWAEFQSNSNSTIIWARPLKMFLEEIELNGERIPRFKKIDK